MTAADEPAEYTMPEMEAMGDAVETLSIAFAEFRSPGAGHACVDPEHCSQCVDELNEECCICGLVPDGKPAVPKA
jgi:hypothetical protein